MSIDTDEAGRVMAPHHDGILDGILNVADSETWLLFRCSGGVQRSIRLVGVHEICVSNFRGGNIILDMMVHQAPIAKNMVSEEQRARLGHGQALPLRGKVLFVLDSSYGAEVVADCDDVEHYVGWTTVLA